jgi:hypothetical protein
LMQDYFNDPYIYSLFYFVEGTTCEGVSFFKS